MIIPPTSSSSSSSQSEGKNGIYRLKRGTKLSEIPPLPPNPAVPDLSSLNGPFQLAEYLSLKIRNDPHDVRGLIDVPVGDKSMGGKAPDKNVWIYEHLRRLPIDLTPLITALLPICTRETCPEMKAHEWLYLCSAHGGGAESCSAIDYILHTLDSTTALLNSSQNFPSRMQIPPSSVSHFPSLFRRLSRIFSHAYFHHREAFQLSENETSLYSRFLGLCEKFNLVGNSLLPIPRDAVVLSKANEEKDSSSSDEEDEGRGRNYGSYKEKEKRTQSLDRSLPPTTIQSPTKSISSPSKPPGPTRNETLKPDQTTEQGYGTIRDNSEVPNIPSSPLKFGTGKGKNTLGRGKQPRATMHWVDQAGEAIPPLLSSNSTLENPSTTSTSPGKNTNKNRDRSESIDTVIHLNEEPDSKSEATTSQNNSQDQAVTLPDELKEENLENIKTPLEKESKQEESSLAEEEKLEAEEVVKEGEEEIVPKDEIELLEEKGELSPENTVAPLAPSSSSSTETQAEEKKVHSDLSGDVQEVESELAQSEKGKEDNEPQEAKTEIEGEVKGESQGEKKDDDDTEIPKSVQNATEGNSTATSAGTETTKGKNKKKLSPLSKPLTSSSSSSGTNVSIPSPIKGTGKGKLVPAELSSPSQSIVDTEDKEKKEKEKVEEKDIEKKE
ncbi:uncharacterized protein L199_007460 [Kwoniella botswanensis]|uniref:uncharacterized protein n=1 Tax=Kwoniella botswanensis TaxID=1268659 RepID=UPI00315C6F8A